MIATVVQNLRDWPLRRWLSGAAAAVLIYVVVAIPTVLIPNNFFSREIPPTWWSYTALGLSSLITGLLVATYVASPIARTGPPTSRAFSPHCSHSSPWAAPCATSWCCWRWAPPAP